jgi:hypothetical protein
MAYPSVYPTSLDSYTAKTDNVDDVMAVDVNELQSAIVAIETKLGTGQFHAATGDGATWGFKAGASLDVLFYRRAADMWGTPDGVWADGSIGVGRSPTALLDVYSAASHGLGVFATGDATKYARVSFVNPNGILYIGTDTSAGGITGIANAAFIDMANVFPIVFLTNGTVRMKVGSGGIINITLAGLTQYANNAAAAAGGKVSGDLYRTGGDPDLVCVVH